MRAGVVAIALCAACTGPTVGGSDDPDAAGGSAGAAGSDGGAGAGGADASTDASDADGGQLGPQILASGRDCPSDLRVHAGVVVWVDQGSLQKSAYDGVVATVPAEGCSGEAGSCITVLASDQPSPSAVEIDRAESTIYWATIWDDSIWKLETDASAPQLFASAQDWPRWLAIDIGSLYWTNAGALGQANGEIRRAWLDGSSGNGSAIVSGLSTPHALTITTDAIYFTTYGVNDIDGSLMGAQLTGQGAGTIADNQSDPRGVAANASHVFWVNAYDGTLMRAKRDGTEVTQLITGLSTPSDVAVDAQGIYWVEAGTPIDFADGLVRAAHLDGSNVTVIAAGLLDPRRIEIDQSHVYWINRGTQGVSKCAQHDGSVMRAEKPW